MSCAHVFRLSLFFGLCLRSRCEGVRCRSSRLSLTRYRHMAQKRSRLGIFSTTFERAICPYRSRCESRSGPHQNATIISSANETRSSVPKVRVGARAGKSLLLWLLPCHPITLYHLLCSQFHLVRHETIVLYLAMILGGAEFYPFRIQTCVGRFQTRTMTTTQASTIRACAHAEPHTLSPVDPCPTSPCPRM